MIKAGGKNFKNKTTLTNQCKYILNTAKLDTLLEGSWLELMKDVVRMHESADEKIGDGDFSVGVRVCPINPRRRRQFYILRENGTDTDFSYYKAIAGSTSKDSHIKRTLRDAVKQQTIDFKNAYFKEHQDSAGYVRCEETGLKIKKREAHLDHYPKQFDEIVKDWVNKYNVKAEEVELINPGDNTTVWEMADKDLLNKFIEMHKEVAQYRVVLGKVNLQRSPAKRFKF